MLIGMSKKNLVVVSVVVVPEGCRRVAAIEGAAAQVGVEMTARREVTAAGTVNICGGAPNVVATATVQKRGMTALADRVEARGFCRAAKT